MFDARQLAAFTLSVAGLAACPGSHDDAASDGGSPADAADGAPDAHAPEDPFVEVAVDFDHACARRSSGRVYCWGLNARGQLGDGTRTSRGAPAAVVGLEDAVKVIVDFGMSCAIRASGAVVCLGEWFESVDLDHPTAGRAEDALVPRLTFEGPCLDAQLERGRLCVLEADQIRCRYTFANEAGSTFPVPVGARTMGGECVIDADGALFCGRTAEPPAPLDTPAPAVDVSSALVVLADGRALSIRGDSSAGYTLVALPGIVDAVDAVGTCVVRRAGPPGCRREPASLPLGPSPRDGSPDAVYTFPDAPTLGSFSYGGRYYMTSACGIDSMNRVVCWGSDTYGVLGRGVSPVTATPTRVVGLGPDRVVDIDAGWTHTCAALSSGLVGCWGGVYYSIYVPGRPILLPGTSAPVHVSSENGVSLLWNALGEAWQIFLSRPGRLTVARLAPPVRVRWAQAPGTMNDTWRGLFAGVLDDRGDVWTATLRPSEPEPFARTWISYEGADALFSGCGVTFGPPGELSCPGRDAIISDPSGFADADGGETGMCVASMDGSVRCIGDNDYGQLGVGDDEAHSDIQSVPGIDTATHVGVGLNHACVVHDGGRVACWGTSELGALGLLANVAFEPVPVPGIEDAVDVTAGGGHTCALRATGDLVCWGLDAFVGHERSGWLAPAEPVRFPD